MGGGLGGDIEEKSKSNTSNAELSLTPMDTVLALVCIEKFEIHSDGDAIYHQKVYKMKNCSNNYMEGEDVNIFEMANQNLDSLKTRYKSLKENYEGQDNFGIFSNFVKLVKDKWSISINMRQGVLNNFLIAGKYKNVYEVKKEQGGELRKVRKLEISEEQAVKNHLKGYYKSRETFNRTFEDGAKFKYGALNIGGHGLKKHGDYCVVIKREQSEDYTSLAFVKQDSLNYVEEDHLNIERLSQDIANRECVHTLVALKHENNIEGIPTDELASMICCDESYIEAITTDEIKNSHIESVRMSKDEYRLYYDYLFKDYTSEISEMKKYQLYILLGIFKLLDKQGIKLEVIGENEN